MSKKAMYKMHNNKYLGNCFSLVYEFDQIPAGFTRPEVTILVKTTDEVWNRIHTLEDFMKETLFTDEVPFLRIGSECMLGVMGDSHCNCEEERIESLKKIGENTGVYMHLPQEAQGMGLHYKAQELHLQVNGFLPEGEYVGCQTQTSAAAMLTGRRLIDIRKFDCMGQIFRDLGLEKYAYRFMSRNPNKVKSMKADGIRIDSMYDIMTKINADNMGEYLTKWIEKGFCFTANEVEQVIAFMKSDEELPVRAKELLKEAADMLTTEQGRAYLQKHLYVSETCRTELFGLITTGFGHSDAKAA